MNNTKTKSARIGPKMAAVLDYVENHPGCRKIDPARYVGPHGSLRFGYAVVERAIKAGLIVASPGARRGWYSLRLAGVR